MILVFNGTQYDVPVKKKGPTVFGSILLAHNSVLLPNVEKFVEKPIEPEEDIPK